MISKINLGLPGCYGLSVDAFNDERGSFVKLFSSELLTKLNLDFRPKETFISCSKKNVIRGMHFQSPPYAQSKLVWCISGTAEDVLLDLRGGQNYGKHVSVTLSSEGLQGVFMPEGIAHGFSALSENTAMLYLVSSGHNPSYDLGIKWDSFGFDWKIDKPIISSRDQAHPKLDNLKQLQWNNYL